MYAAPQRVEVVAKAHTDTSAARGQVQYDVGQAPVTFNPVTKNVNPQPPGMAQAETYRIHHAPSYQDPNDPNAAP